VAAIDLRPRGRQAKREAITATGATEVAALEALVALVEARDEVVAPMWSLGERTGHPGGRLRAEVCVVEPDGYQ
jgi:hypothetical protein